MREAVVDQDQVKEWVLIETALDALSVGSMIILPKTVQIYKIQKKKSEQIQQMLNLEEDKTTLKVLVTDNYENLIQANSEETTDHLN